MGPGVEYVSGRTRSPGEMNGKSANLNNCLEQIFPKDYHIPPSELICIFDADQVCHDCRIPRDMSRPLQPLDEIITTVQLQVQVDALLEPSLGLQPIPVSNWETLALTEAHFTIPVQLANSDFYIKTVPLFDAGDDVGMVLSPQAFHNLRLHADIFNHANIHFWEYAQHGYDAMGFISCTGAGLHAANAHKFTCKTS